MNLKEKFERLELSDPEDKGCSITLAEYLGSENVEIIWRFFVKMVEEFEVVKK